jgi:hypothetical protein
MGEPAWWIGALAKGAVALALVVGSGASRPLMMFVPPNGIPWRPLVTHMIALGAHVIADYHATSFEPR